MGRQFVKKMINWNTPLFGGLNSVLYLLVDSGLKAVISATELWCLEHKNHDNDSISTKSSFLASGASSVQSSDIKPSALAHLFITLQTPVATMANLSAITEMGKYGPLKLCINGLATIFTLLTVDQ